MAVILLRVEWDYGCEYLQFDTLAPLEPDATVATTEWWPAERKRVKYKATCVKWRLEASTLEVSLRYEHEHNEELSKDQVRWGVSEISVDLGKRTAEARWTDKDDPKKWNGNARHCRIVNEEDAAFFADMSYDTYLRVARPGQAQLRDEMLRKNGACAITGTTTEAILDIAHIDEARNGGRALWSNCMLLRVDIHRLFDAGLIRFSPDGTALLDRSIAEEYKDLQARKMDPEVFALVREALALRSH